MQATSAVPSVTEVPKAVQWLIEKSKPMIDRHNNTIPGSGHFSGTLPVRMRDEIRNWLVTINAVHRDGRKEVTYNFRYKGMGYSIHFGAYMSTRNRVRFNFCPDEY